MFTGVEMVLTEKNHLFTTLKKIDTTISYGITESKFLDNSLMSNC